jgi:hypothetical protein
MRKQTKVGRLQRKEDINMEKNVRTRAEVDTPSERKKKLLKFKVMNGGFPGLAKLVAILMRLKLLGCFSISMASRIRREE